MNRCILVLNSTLGWSLTSIFRALGDSLRTTTSRCAVYQGSTARYRPAAMIAADDLVARRWASVHPDATTAFASRTDVPPRHAATPTHRGRPRLPVPAARRANFSTTASAPGSWRSIGWRYFRAML